MRLGRLQPRHARATSRSTAAPAALGRSAYHQAPTCRPQAESRRPGPLLFQLLLQACRERRQQGFGSPSLLAFCLVAPPAAAQSPSLAATAPGLRVPREEASAAPQPSPQHRTGLRRLFSLRAPRKPALPARDGTASPETIADVTEVVAANVPVFFFHNKERYFPCTVEWFLERSQLIKIAKGWRRKVLATLVDFGALDAAELARQQAKFDATDAAERRRQFLQLKLDPAARAGEPGDIDEIPIYAHVKQTLDPILGKRDGLEINYMKFLAYNGPYKLFHRLWVGPLGAHDADWEHVTVRLTPDGRKVTGVYYSAHRHRDGTWRSADAVPRSAAGRPLAYIAENGHGSYPVAGTILRLFFVINDYTSDDGRQWDPKRVVLLTQGDNDRLPAVVSRGSSLNGSTYAAPARGLSTKRKGEVVVERQAAAWLKFEGKWGSTVEAPQRQEWFARAENPVSRTWLQQVLFPLLPGVETVWEPVREEIEEAIEGFADGMDAGMDRFQGAADDVRAEFERARGRALRRWQEAVKGFKWRDD